MSPATIDRRLAGARTGLVAATISHTRPGSMLKSSIPMKTWREWDDTIPGFLQIDLVGHEGGDNNGAFHYSLNATDVTTGWTETVTVPSKGERIVAAGLEVLWLRCVGVMGTGRDSTLNLRLALSRWARVHEVRGPAGGGAELEGGSTAGVLPRWARELGGGEPRAMG